MGKREITETYVHAYRYWNKHISGRTVHSKQKNDREVSAQVLLGNKLVVRA